MYYRKMTPEDIALWKSRRTTENIEELMSEKFLNALRIFHTRIEVLRYSIGEKLLKSKKPIHTLTAINCPDSAKN